MNQIAHEQTHIPVLARAADRLARILHEGGRAGWPRKRLLAMLAQRTRSIRAYCPKCAAEWPLVSLGQEDARHICVVARRVSFVTLRRRLEEHFHRAPLRCPACTARDKACATGGGAGVAEGDGQYADAGDIALASSGRESRPEERPR
jgi:hypothetical protein